ncbi:MAG TPA: 2-oxoglutarate and iron-dependent oxygenase domain-containing protein [Ilumatobacteraceae bacterium]|nr:2-oxoglutarate and iron-dependent oxygenase domain-containing protein [Ilumatobacteraceae bacterium]
MDARSSAAEVPTIDLDREPAVVAVEFDAVCREVGFFQIINHGFPTEVADAAWDAATAFFDLPLADRMSVARPSGGYPYGYIPIAEETLTRSLGGESAPDLKEVFNVGPIDSPGRPFADPGEAEVYSPNLWPTALPELRATWEPYYREMLKLSSRLMSLFALGLELPSNYFEPYIDTSPSALRAVNYPEQAHAPSPGQLRAGAHTDYGTLTILRQDDAPGGLEVRSPNENRWVPIPIVPDAFVINVGDLLARWTNDRWRSTLHRVVNPDVGETRSTRRQSMPFFHNANYHSVVACLPTCFEPGQQPKYPPVTAGVHLMTKFKRTVYASE